ncbi:MAG: hypothetical protein Q9227_000617 [Pyrenula ochraceoflavens]
MANDTDIGQLTESQKEALQMYTSVTDQDPITAIPLLQRSSWNVQVSARSTLPRYDLIESQIAITKFFDGEQPGPLEEARASMNNHAPPSQSSRQAQNLQYDLLRSSSRSPSSITRSENVSRIPPQSTSQSTYRAPTLLSILFAPFSLAFRIFSTILSYIPFFPRLFSRLFSPTASRRSATSSGRRPLSPNDAAARFVREFGEQYGTDHTLSFTESGFNSCLDSAKSSLKFLLVVLFSPEHDDTASWTTNTLLSSQFQSFYRDHQSELILWGGNVQDPEAYAVAEELKCTKFPFAALIVHTPDNGSTAMSTVARCVGPMPASEFVAKLAATMTAHSEPLERVRLQRQEQAAQRNLRAEQESAYERSLAQDREKTRKRKEEEQRKAREEKEALEKAEREEQDRHNLAQWKRWRAASLQKEPEAAGALRVSIRMREGERVIRRFNADAEIEELYAFVECYDTLNNKNDRDEQPSPSLENAEEPVGFEHKYGFQLVSPMPRAVYDLESGGTIGERVGKGANLIVESIGEEDEDEEERDA